jgi:NAD(P)-dependent dehydrogenase (short-subunit alcohol dehydrogenase family)
MSEASARAGSAPSGGQDAVTDSLAGKVVLVTGGGGGLGAAVCRTVAGAGAHAVAADIDHARALECADQIAKTGCRGMAVELDVGSEQSVTSAFEAVFGRFGRIDAVVNNAAVDVTLPLDELATADWERIIRTNLTGPYLVAKLAVRLMKRQGHGDIVNIASTASKRAWPNAAAYHASKWGLLGLSHALHAELRPHGIKVCAVVAGGMRTPFLLGRFPDIDLETLQDPDSVAKAVCFVLTQPAGTVVPEITVLPMRETSWP